MIENTRTTFFVDYGIQYKLYLTIKNCKIGEGEGERAMHRKHQGLLSSAQRRIAPVVTRRAWSRVAVQGFFVRNPGRPPGLLHQFSNTGVRTSASCHHPVSTLHRI